jgi:hypothetical protein
MKLIRLLLSAALLSALSLPSARLAAAQVAAAKATATPSPATAFARQAGAIAGAAIFCKIDQDKQEIYLDWALARIAISANDEIDLVVSRVTFSNEKNHASAIEPDGGCEEFRRQFSARIAGFD